MAGLQCNKFRGDKDKINLVLPIRVMLQVLGEILQVGRQELLSATTIKEKGMASQCTQPKRPRNVAWYKEKAMLVEAQEAEQILDEEQLAFLADPRILTDQYNQSVQALHDFEQTPIMDFTDNEIFSDSNIIPYSQYLRETQHATVQDTNLQAQQDSMIFVCD
ncbi:hypothetical protein Tco_1306215 [Tanacetum coccineum]